MKKTEYTVAQINRLNELISYSNRYQINIQFWPDQTAVYISKEGVDLKDYGGSFNHAVGSALEYLNRINAKSNK